MSNHIRLIQTNFQLFSIDFDRARQQNLDKPSVCDKNTKIVQIYEWDALEIQSKQSITGDFLKSIFQSVWKDIFAYNISSLNRGEVEFINANGKD